MVKVKKDGMDRRQTEDHQSHGVTNLTQTIKERVSPAVETWVNLIADVIVEEVLREQRARPEAPHSDTVAPADEPRQQERAGISRDDQGQKVLAPRGRLLTIQEAADFLGISRVSLAGRGWRIKNRLPAIKVGRSVRFDKEALDRWIDRHRERLPRSFGEMEDE